MLPEIYEIQYGFLDSGEARELTREEYHDGVVGVPGPMTTMKRDKNLPDG